MDWFLLRPGRESNPRIAVLQTAALPLGDQDMVPSTVASNGAGFKSSAAQVVSHSLFLCLDLLYNRVEVLAMALSSVDHEFKMRDALETTVAFEVLAKLRAMALEEDQRILLSVVRDRGEVNDGVLAIRAYGRASYGDQWVSVGLGAHEVRREFLQGGGEWGRALRRTRAMRDLAG